MSRMYLVLAVRGEMVLDPSTIGHAQKRFIGYAKVEKGTRVDPRINAVGNPNQLVPHFDHVFVENAEPEFISETTDFHVRRMILNDGSLIYLGTVDHYGTAREKLYVDADMRAASERHRMRRADPTERFAAS